MHGRKSKNLDSWRFSTYPWSFFEILHAIAPIAFILSTTMLPRAAELHGRKSKNLDSWRFSTYARSFFEIRQVKYTIEVIQWALLAPWPANRLMLMHRCNKRVGIDTIATTTIPWNTIIASFLTSDLTPQADNVLSRNGTANRLMAAFAASNGSFQYKASIWP